MCLSFVGPYNGRYWEASMMRHWEALVVSMVGRPIGTVTPPDASKVKRNKNS